jgi:hypothetical protein
MATVALKNKIYKSVDQMNEQQLKSAWLILKELSNQREYNIKIDKSTVDKKIATGIAQLENGDGSDFGMFLNEMQEVYGTKK